MSGAGVTAGSVEAQSDRVSVIIATYNRAPLLPRAITSVLRQTYGDVELIVVDDGSTDDTAAVVDEISSSADRPVSLLRKVNGGCASARNLGARHATGQWLCFLDSDDELAHTALAMLVATAAPSLADFVYSPAVEVDTRGNQHVNVPVAAGTPERLAIEHFRNTNIRTGSYIVRTDLFRRLGGFEESYSHNEDSDFVQRMAIEARGAYSAQPSVRCYTHEGGKSRNRVAIHQALLSSTEATLSRYPAFAQTLGPAAGHRVTQLRTALIDALILAGRLDEAAAHIRRSGWHIPPASRLALVLHTTFPVRVRHFIRHVAHGAMHRVKRRLSAPSRAMDT